MPEHSRKGNGRGGVSGQLGPGSSSNPLIQWVAQPMDHNLSVSRGWLDDKVDVHCLPLEESHSTAISTWRHALILPTGYIAFAFPFSDEREGPSM